ncbi:MAG: cyclic nucleotide-binding domain-containing protein, partial [Caldilinea sp.]|nr:cyclic nucleotide-binding domain-containing protein [Caldilinea sp.]
PLGGYHSFPAEPWLLLGATGVVRGAERSATIVAERDTQVLMIPSSVYLAHWHHTLSIAEFQAAIERVRAESAKGAGAYGLLEKIALLRGISLFRTLDHEVLTDLAARAEAVHVASGTTVIAKGSFGNTLFVVAKGELRVHDGPHDFRRLAPGDAFGELAALAPEARTASVTATAESSLLQVSQADLAALVDENRAVAQAMFEVLAGYVRDQTDEIARLRAALADLKARRDA